jgi:DNA-directed RNA polymerase subunit RPC12/RpoP
MALYYCIRCGKRDQVITSTDLLKCKQCGEKIMYKQRTKEIVTVLAR